MLQIPFDSQLLKTNLNEYIRYSTFDNDGVDLKTTKLDNAELPNKLIMKGCWALFSTFLLADVLFCECSFGGDTYHHAGPKASNSQKPHIFMVIVDDFGWAEVGYHRNSTYKKDVYTPTIDALVNEGIELNRHYVGTSNQPSLNYSFQSGRLPVHVQLSLTQPCQPRGGMPQNMTGIAQHLKKGGYATHFVGKWDVGMATPTHTPAGRGYDTSLNYFGHGNWMWNEEEWQGSQNNASVRPPCQPPTCFKDFWDTNKPASSLNGTQYEEFIFRDRLFEIASEHDPTTPLFLTYASKVAHYPLQAPLEYQQKFSSIDQINRRVYHAMVNVLDDILANITTVFKHREMWNNTLMVLTSDNGGYVKALKGPCDHNTPSRGYMCYNGEAGANNFPLRGGKYSTLEGGIRANAFVSGGALPDIVRGQVRTGIIHIADWYSTFAFLAGVDPFDHKAAQHGLPPIDSLNVWPYLTGQAPISPRETILVTKDCLLHKNWKVLTGKVIEANWGGPNYPNASTTNDPIDNYTIDCGSKGCLFDVAVDSEERHDVADKNPDTLNFLLELKSSLSQTIWHNDPGHPDPACPAAAEHLYGGFYGPWIDVVTTT
eukprot:gene4931-6915_t